MYRKTNIKVFEPLNPEYTLVDSLTQELQDKLSPEIYWWSFVTDNMKDAPDRDVLDKIYQEKSSPGKEKYLGPFEVRGLLDINPVIAELTRLGMNVIQEIEFTAGIAAMNEYLNGLSPKSGDIFRVSWIKNEKDRNFVFYKVANVTPVDSFMFKYINWHIHAEQTTLHEAPDNIKQFSDTIYGN